MKHKAQVYMDKQNITNTLLNQEYYNFIIFQHFS